MTDTGRTTTLSFRGDTCVSSIGDSARPCLIIGQDCRPSESASLKSSCQENQEPEPFPAYQSVITVPQADHEQCGDCHCLFLKVHGYFYRGKFMCDECASSLAENGEFYA